MKQMFYKPKYCCECGERIVRRNWTIWSSKRFCEACEIDRKMEELFPKTLVLFALVFGLFGVGSLFWGGKNLEEPKRFLIKAEVERGNRNDRICGEVDKNEAGGNVVKVREADGNIKTERSVEGNTDSRDKNKEGKAEVETQLYYCGAMTKKGTPCMRKVKGGGRCWQHKGQPAMLKPEELLVKK